MSIMTRRKLKGLLKSKLAHAGMWLAVLGQVQAQSEFLSKQFSPAALGWFMFAVGTLVVALRWWTNQPLETK